MAGHHCRRYGTTAPGQRSPLDGLGAVNITFLVSRQARPRKLLRCVPSLRGPSLCAILVRVFFDSFLRSPLHVGIALVPIRSA